MHVELLGQLGQRPLALHGGEGHLRLEGRGVVPARSSRHRLSLPAAILAAVRQKLHSPRLSRFPEPALFTKLGLTGLPLATISLTIIFSLLATANPGTFLDLAKLTLGAFIGSYVQRNVEIRRADAALPVASTAHPKPEVPASQAERLTA